MNAGKYSLTLPGDGLLLERSFFQEADIFETGRRTNMKTRWFPVIGIFWAMALTGWGCQGEGDDTLPHRTVSSDLPITRVVLYQNGVGYIERAGKLKGNKLSLRIRHDQVKDILKTLTVVDRRGGHAVSIALPVEKGRLEAMEELPPQVRNSGGILTIAQAFRGALCRMETKRGTYTGRLVGVENVGNAKNNRYRVTLLEKGGVLSVHKLEDIEALQVRDRTLTVGLEKSLDIALDKGTWKPVNLTIRLNHDGEHDLVVSYVVEMPVWKPAYRLIVGNSGDKLLLQGWSVVDNLSGDEWNRVWLSLTAGTPLAFMYDLYTPQGVRRPDLTPSQRYAEAPPNPVDATYAEAAPKEESAAEDGESDDEDEGYARKDMAPRAPAAQSPSKSMAMESLGYGRGGYRDEPKPSPVSLEEMRSSFNRMVSGTTVGSLFRYDIAERISVPDRSSALVTLINKDVEGKDVLYYITEQSDDGIPYRAVRFRNTSGFVLERGPVAIYKDGQFVGEALGGVVEKDATAFVPYAREGKVIIHQDVRWENEGERLLSIINGIITVEERQVNIFEYTVTNRAGEDFTLYVRRDRRTNWEPVDAKDYIFEKDVYYVPVKAGKGETKFSIREQTPVRRTYGITSMRSKEIMLLLIKSPQLRPELRKSLEEVIKLWEEIQDLATQMNTIEGNRRMLREQQDDQARNLKVLGDKGNKDLRDKIEKSLAALAEDLDKLNRRWVELNMQKGEKERRLQMLFKTITFKSEENK